MSGKMNLGAAGNYSFGNFSKYDKVNKNNINYNQSNFTNNFNNGYEEIDYGNVDCLIGVDESYVELSSSLESAWNDYNSTSSQIQQLQENMKKYSEIEEKIQNYQNNKAMTDSAAATFGYDVSNYLDDLYSQLAQKENDEQLLNDLSIQLSTEKQQIFNLLSLKTYMDPEYDSKCFTKIADIKVEYGDDSNENTIVYYDSDGNIIDSPSDMDIAFFLNSKYGGASLVSTQYYEFINQEIKDIYTILGETNDVQINNLLYYYNVGDSNEFSLYYDEVVGNVNQIIGQREAEEVCNKIDELLKKVNSREELISLLSNYSEQDLTWYEKNGMQTALSQYSQASADDYMVIDSLLAYVGFNDGFTTFCEGLDYSLTGYGDGVLSSTQYKQAAILEHIVELCQSDENILQLLLPTDVYQMSTSIGNMAVPIAASAIVGTISGNPELGQAVGNTLMFLSVSGNTSNTALSQGNNRADSLLYGILVGTAEVGFEKVIGGIPFLSDNASLIPSFQKYLKNCFGEGIEEFSQDLLDSVFSTLILGDSFEIDWNQALQSGIYGFLTSAILSGGTVIFNDVTYNLTSDQILNLEKLFTDMDLTDPAVQTQLSNTLASMTRTESTTIDLDAAKSKIYSVRSWALKNNVSNTTKITDILKIMLGYDLSFNSSAGFIVRFGSVAAVEVILDFCNQNNVSMLTAETCINNNIDASTLVTELTEISSEFNCSKEIAEILFRCKIFEQTNNSEIKPYSRFLSAFDETHNARTAIINNLPTDKDYNISYLGTLSDAQLSKLINSKFEIDWPAYGGIDLENFVGFFDNIDSLKKYLTENGYKFAPESATESATGDIIIYVSRIGNINGKSITIEKDASTFDTVSQRAIPNSDTSVLRSGKFNVTKYYNLMNKIISYTSSFEEIKVTKSDGTTTNLLSMYISLRTNRKVTFTEWLKSQENNSHVENAINEYCISNNIDIAGLSFKDKINKIDSTLRSINLKDITKILCLDDIGDYYSKYKTSSTPKDFYKSELFNNESINYGFVAPASSWDALGAVGGTLQMTTGFTFADLETYGIITTSNISTVGSEKIGWKWNQTASAVTE